MRRTGIAGLLLLVLSSCSVFQYIPSKHIASHQTQTVDDEVFSFYQKQINSKTREVYKFDNTLELLHGITLLQEDLHDFELYYELHDDIDVHEVMSYLRSLSPQRTRMYYGNSSDFGMIKVEPIHPDEYVLAHEEVKRIIAAEMKDIHSQAKQVKFVHDYLVKNVAYDVALNEEESLDQESLSLSVYGTLFHKLAVCEGYARTFLLFMQELEIPSMIIEAQAMNHAWNYVKIDGEWLFVDVTYDDPVPDQNRHLHQDYLMLTEKEFLDKGNHKFDDPAIIGISLEQYQTLAKHMYGD